jgi:hypothetical protein
MIVLESRISNVTRNRDFGMVEARVTLFAKTIAGQPPHDVVVNTHVPARGPNLRARLIASAIGLTRHLTLHGSGAARRIAA